MDVRLIVLKVGTRSITNSNGCLNRNKMEKLVGQVSRVKQHGYNIILVTSGAIALGIAELNVKPNPNDIVFKQACAATGQSILMAHYRALFEVYDQKVAQVLLTEKSLSNRVSYLHVCNVLERLIDLGVVPIINENDVTSINEIIPIMKGYEVNFSDNDILSVLIANAMEADLVVILSTVDGLYSKNPDTPGANLIQLVEKITPNIKEAAEGKNRLGRGGMVTKLKAAEISMRSGIPLVIANSNTPNVLLKILEGKQIGTFFKPNNKSLPGIKRWIAFGAGSKGQIRVNPGAKRAIVKGASLLAVGIDSINGEFQVGDVVSITDLESNEFARCMVNYTSEEIKIIKGMRTSQIGKTLGYIRQNEIASRKRMNIIDDGE